MTNVARASLGELLEDYSDYLIFHSLPLWDTSNPRLQKLRQFLRSERFQNEYQQLCDKLSAEEFCNLAYTLIKQTQYLLTKMIEAQERRFLKEGGIREAMTRARLKYRNGSYGNNGSNGNNGRNGSYGRNGKKGNHKGPFLPSL